MVDHVAPAAYFRWKGPLDRALAALLLVPGLLAIGVLVLLIRLSSRGPGIFRQQRVGKKGRLFTMYKLRTMYRDAERTTGPVWTQAYDPRVTPLGKVLRKLHLDEFPQLVNVLLGHMSLVGPRPERPEFTDVLAELIPLYTNRLMISPGITGLAQINLPPDSDLESVRRKLYLDLEYLQQAGPLLDLRVFLCTLLRLVGIPGAYVMWLFGLHRKVPVSGKRLPAFSQGAASRPSLVTPPSIIQGDGCRPGYVAHEAIDPKAGHNARSRDARWRRKPR